MKTKQRPPLPKIGEVCAYESTSTGLVHVVDVKKANRYAARKLSVFETEPQIGIANGYVAEGLVDVAYMRDRFQQDNAWLQQPILYVVEDGKVQLIDGKHRYCMAALLQKLYPCSIPMRQLPYRLIRKVCVADAFERHLGLSNIELKTYLYNNGSLVPPQLDIDITSARRA